jgi:hypothetical protein
MTSAGKPSAEWARCIKSYKNVVKLTFAKGASLKDPARLFNASLDGNVRCAIDIHRAKS